MTVYLVYRSFGERSSPPHALLIAPHFGFYLDRLRQFTEHNLMPLDNRSGARSFGIGFWGLFMGGGPWGQPCHSGASSGRQHSLVSADRPAPLPETVVDASAAHSSS